jgi:hypothetical protein
MSAKRMVFTRDIDHWSIYDPKTKPILAPKNKMVVVIV